LAASAVRNKAPILPGFSELPPLKSVGCLTIRQIILGFCFAINLQYLDTPVLKYIFVDFYLLSSFAIFFASVSEQISG
jgi:hypothetical protein